MVMRDGQVLSFGERHITEDMLFGAFRHIQAMTGRLDGDSIFEWHRHCDSEALESWEHSGRQLPRGLIERWDSYCDSLRHDEGPDVGVTAFPRELEFMRARELLQPRAPLNSAIFPVDRSVPVGAREHGWRRRQGRGEVVLTRGDTTNLGHATTGRKEEKFPVVYLVCSVRQTYFEMLSNDYAGVEQYEADLREARTLIDEEKNRLLWFGENAMQITGATNHPHLLKVPLSVVIGGSGTSSPEAIAAAILRFIDTPARLSKEAMSPNVLAVSPNIWRHISQTMLNTAGNGITIRKHIENGQDPTNGIKRIVKCQELAGIGPNGEDGLLAFRDDIDSCANVETLPTMTMPVYQASALSWITVVIAGTGGIKMPNVGNNILGLAQAP